MTPDAMKRVLGIFAKRPRPGQVKTRLAAATSDDFAARLAEAFLFDLIADCQEIDAERVIVFSPSSEREWFEGHARHWRLQPQCEGDLGARLADYFNRNTSLGQRAVAVGSDSPNFPISWIALAFAHLAAADVVLAPAFDGGYALIGCSGFHAELFHEVEWGGPSVLRQTVQRAESAGLRLALLPPWYDVDTLEDCRFLKAHLLAQRLAGEETAARSWRVLEDLSR